MPIDPKGDPWSGATYKGFSGGPAAQAGAPVRRRPSRALLIGGVAGALALGLLFGLALRPELIGSRTAAPVAPVSPPPAPLATPGTAQVPIAVSPTPAASPEPIPRAPGRLETLPPEMAAAARAQVRPEAVSPPAISPSPPGAPAVVVAPATPPLAPLEADAAAPAPRYRASFDCATARPGAEEMVCSDASLAAADRQLARAYRRALRSGIEPADLRQEQRDWVAIREDAARHSRQALADVYDQRIRDLQEIADNAPGGEGGD